LNKKYYATKHVGGIMHTMRQLSLARSGWECECWALTINDRLVNCCKQLLSAVVLIGCALCSSEEVETMMTDDYLQYIYTSL